MTSQERAQEVANRIDRNFSYLAPEVSRGWYLVEKGYIDPALLGEPEPEPDPEPGPDNLDTLIEQIAAASTEAWRQSIKAILGVA